MKAYVAELLSLASFKHRSVFRPAIIVLAIGVVLSVIFARMTHKNEVEEGQLRFQGLGDAVASAIVEVMDTDESVLRGAAAMLNVVGDIDHTKWAAYARKLQLRQNYPGIQGLGFAKVIAPDQIDAFQSRMRADRPSFTFHPSDGTRDLKTSIAFLEPADERNARALGFDMYSEPTRRTAMQRARDTGASALTSSVRLAQEDGRDEQPGALMYLPVYGSSTVPHTIEQRRATLVGFVFTPLRMRDLIGRTLNQLREYEAALIRVRLFDASRSGADDMLFDSHALRKVEAGPATHSYMRQLLISGVPWTVHMYSTGLFDSRYRTVLPWVVGILGLGISLLPSAFLATVVAGRERARMTVRQLADEMTTRKRAEEQAKVAVHELTHRVKNTLSIVTALASQTVRHSASLGEFDQAFRSRLLGLARVHDLLASGRSYSTELSALASEVLKPYRGDAPGALIVRGPPVVLAPNTAVLLSMLLNELATNATKYGAWRNDAGSVSFAWRLDQVGETSLLFMTWQESGGPKVGPVTRTGFGSNVMKFAIERSLGGTAESELAESGVIYRFSIPWGLDDRAHEHSAADPKMAD